LPPIATSDSASTSGKWSRPLGISFVHFPPNPTISTDKPPKKKSTQLFFVGVATRETSIYRSADAGATWEAVPEQPVGLRPNHAAFAADGMLFVSYGDDAGPNTMTDGAVWKLDTNSGKWSDITPEKPTAQRRFGYGSICVDAPHPQTVLAATFCRWNGGDDIYRSTDGGNSWKSLKEKSVRDSSAAPWLRWGKDEAPFGHWIGDVEIDPSDSNRAIYTTGWGVWMTKDLTNADKDRPTHWTFTQGIEECVVNNVISPPSGVHLLSVMWDIDGFRHENLDVSAPEGFFRPQVGRNTDIDFAEKNPDVMARVFDGNNTHGAFSTDNGRTWTSFASAPQGKGAGDIAVSSDGATFVSTPDDGAPQVSHDHGGGWKTCEGIPEKLRVVSDRVEPKLFYSLDPSSGTIYVSSDGGDHFAARASDLPKAAGFLRAMPDHAGNVALASDGGLFGSEDSGASFRQVHVVESAKRIGYGKAAPGQSYSAIYVIGKIGGVYGFYRSDDLGATWIRINDDQHQYGGVTSITGDPRIYGRVYVGSSNRGIVYGEP
jgi:photosystem II stability/assembly factor-like uncharacterized protein